MELNNLRLEKWKRIEKKAVFKMNPKIALCVALVLGIPIMVIVLVSISLGRLQTHEVGLQYDNVWKKLGDEVYNEGLHMGPPGYSFIIFPSIFKSISFEDVTAISKDGASIQLDISYQYRVRPTKLKEIIVQFQNHNTFRRFLEVIGEAVVQDSVAYFNTSQLMSSRAEFQDKVRSEIRQQHGRMNCDVADIQVENIRLPRKYESAVRAKEASREEITVARSERDRLITQAKTDKREAMTETNITLNKAQTNARIVLTEAERQAAAVAHQFAKDTESLITIKTDLGLSNSGLISYMTSRVIAQNSHDVYIGLPSPAKKK